MLLSAAALHRALSMVSSLPRRAFFAMRERVVAQRGAVSREAMYIENFALLELTLDHLNQGLASGLAG